jgi:predicted ATPase/DNA-binding SARP family transcriptional activator
MRITLTLLGTFEAQLDRQKLGASAFKHKHPRLVLQMLALQPGLQLQRERLLERLWPDSATPAADNRLYNTLHNLRSTFTRTGLPKEQPIVLLQADRVLLNPEHHYTIDLQEYGMLIAQARTLGSNDLTQQTSQTAQAIVLRQAIDLYQGELLSGAPYEDWLAPQRQQSKADYLWALERLAITARDSGDLETAIDYYQRLVDAEPSNEPAHRALMEAFDANENPSRAILQFSACKRLLQRDLDATPSAQTLSLLAQITAKSKAKQASGNCVVQPTIPVASRYVAPAHTVPLLGRADDLAATQSMVLQGNVRLASIVGAPGSGKTRLAHALVERCQDQFANGVFVVALSAVSEPRELADHLASAMGVSGEGGATEIRLCRHVADRHMLILLDRFEHILPAVTLVSALLAAAPRLTILVTSQAPLRCAAECVYELPSLLARSPDDAVALFQRVAHNLSVPMPLEHASQRAIVVDICQRLGGNALAIEIAAAQTQTLTLTQVADGLTQSFALLTNPTRDVEAQHRSLHDAIEWSYSLLEPSVRRVFAMLSVFSATFTLDDATSVLKAFVEHDQLRNGIRSLIDKHLLVRQDVLATNGKEAAIRFTFLDTVRLLAQEKRQERSLAEGEESIVEAHARYFAERIRGLTAMLRKGTPSAVTEQFAAMQADATQCLKWYAAHESIVERLDLVGQAGTLFLLMGNLATAHFYASAALLAANPQSVAEKNAAAWCHHVLSRCYFFSGQPRKTIRHLRAARSLAKGGGDDLLQERVNSGLALELMGQMRIGAARHVIQQSIRNSTASGDRANLAVSHFFAAAVEFHAGNYTDAQRFGEQALELAIGVQNLRVVGYALHLQAEINLRSGHTERAKSILDECAPVAMQVFGAMGTFLLRYTEFELYFETMKFESACNLLADIAMAPTPALRMVVALAKEFVSVEHPSLAVPNAIAVNNEDVYVFDATLPQVYIQRGCYGIRKAALEGNWAQVKTALNTVQAILRRVPNPLWHAWLFEACAHALVAREQGGVAKNALAYSKALVEHADVKPTPRQLRSWALAETGMPAAGQSESAESLAPMLWSGPSNASLEILYRWMEHALVDDKKSNQSARGSVPISKELAAA